MRAVWSLVVVSLAVVYGQNIDNVVILPPARTPGIVQASSKCIEELNLEKDILQKFLALELGDSESTRKYLYCLGTGSGYIANDGSIIKNEVLEVVGNHRDRVDGVIDECHKLKYNDKYEAVFRNVMCFYEKSKLQFKV
uniref:Odorant binding protein 25 n=1 Tax=Heliconius charithonia TaxID=33434 RepID=A0AA49EZW9_HELCH|nr:odorant binding protein 25 [Heliconius charithonia]